MMALATAVAGGVGAVARYVTDNAIHRVNKPGFLLGTLVINVMGSLLLGIATGLLGAGALLAEAERVVGVGFLGGFTTFSTACVEAMRYLSGGHGRAALLHVVAMIAVPLAAAAAGLAIGAVVAA